MGARTAWKPPRKPKSTWSAGRLGLQPGMRVLDVGCGWGSFALHAARRFGVDVVGVTLSTNRRGWPANAWPTPA